MPTLVIFSRDWADEFQCEEFIITELSKDDAEKLIFNKLQKSYEYYFGTNEGFETNDLSIQDFEIKEISDQEKETLTKLIGERFGTGILYAMFNDEEEYEEDEE
jgi:hypothetical protein